MVSLTVLFSTFNGAACSRACLMHSSGLRRQPAAGRSWRSIMPVPTTLLLCLNSGRRDCRSPCLPNHAKERTMAQHGFGCGGRRLVVLTDDDVIPREDWLVAMRRVADEQLDYDIFGGEIHPIWPEEPPGWMLRCVPKGHFAWTGFAEGPAEPWQIWGPNMAVRRKVFSDHRFFEGIGPNGDPRLCDRLRD